MAWRSVNRYVQNVQLAAATLATTLSWRAIRYFRSLASIVMHVSVGRRQTQRMQMSNQIHLIYSRYCWSDKESAICVWRLLMLLLHSRTGYRLNRTFIFIAVDQWLELRLRTQTANLSFNVESSSKPSPDKSIVTTIKCIAFESPFAMNRSETLQIRCKRTAAMPTAHGVHIFEYAACRNWWTKAALFAVAWRITAAWNKRGARAWKTDHGHSTRDSYVRPMSLFWFCLFSFTHNVDVKCGVASSALLACWHNAVGMYLSCHADCRLSAPSETWYLLVYKKMCTPTMQFVLSQWLISSASGEDSPCDDKREMRHDNKLHFCLGRKSLSNGMSTIN